MNNYRIARTPYALTDLIGRQRLKIMNEQYANHDIQTEASMYQKLCEEHEKYWEVLGGAITSDWSNVKGEPFIYEKHNAIVNSIDSDLSILYNMFPRVTESVVNNYNYNKVANETLKYRLNYSDGEVDGISEPEIPSNQGHYKITIKDTLKNKSKIDDNMTTADIENGKAILSSEAEGYNLSQQAEAMVINLSRFKDAEGLDKILGAQYDVDISGVESNGFPGATREGYAAYGSVSDEEGNSTMEQVIELAAGQDIRNDISVILDDNADTWYEMEIVNVTEESLQIDQYGWNFSEPNESIRWATGAREGETLKLALLVKFNEQVPASSLNLRLHGTKPKPAYVDGLLIREDGGQWNAVSDLSNIEHTEDIQGVELTDEMIHEETLSAAGQEIARIKQLPKMMWNQQLIAWNSSNTLTPIGIRYDRTIQNVAEAMETFELVEIDPSSGVPADVNIPGWNNYQYQILQNGNYTGTGSIPSYTGNNYEVDTSAAGYDITAGEIKITGNSVSSDKREYKFRFDTQWVKEILILLRQDQSYDCQIIHRYYEHVYETRTTTSNTDTGCFGGSETTQETSYNKTVSRVEGANLPADALFSGLGGTSSTGGSTLAGIGQVVGTVGSGLAMMGVGGALAPVMLGVGAVLSLFGGGDSSTTSSDVTKDFYITGLELMDGWRYAIGIEDINLYGESYESKGEIVTNAFILPFELREVSVSVTYMIPKRYPSGEWLEHYISVDDGISWLPITPKNIGSTVASKPKVYYINPDDDTGSRNSTSVINTDEPVRSIKYKCIINRPQEYPYNLYTPSINSYSISCSGVIEE